MGGLVLVGVAVPVGTVGTSRVRLADRAPLDTDRTLVPLLCHKRTLVEAAGAYSALVRRAATALGLVLVCLVFPPNLGTAAPAAPAAPYEVTLSGAGAGMYPSFSPDVERYAITTTDATDGTVTVSVATTDPSVRVWVNGRPAPDATRTLTGVEAGDEISVFVSHDGTTTTYALVYLPAGFPTLHRVASGGSADTPTPGMVMLTLAKWVQPSPFFETAVDANGVPVYIDSQQAHWTSSGCRTGTTRRRVAGQPSRRGHRGAG